MKMFLGEIPIQSLNIHHFEENTNDATMVASDLQAGITAYARGQKITGTGKTFSFAQYGNMKTNVPIYVPDNVNIIEVASIEYPIRSIISLSDIGSVDFSVAQTIAQVNIDNSSIEITAQVQNNILTFTCTETIDIEVFFGKDEYI